MTDTTTWEAPGPGHWELDRSHYPGGTTPISIWLMELGMERGMARMAEDLGAPISTLRARFVNGFMYTRLVPLVGADKTTTKLPPTIVLKIAARLHPEFRRRTRTATANLAHPPGPAVVRRWETELKPEIVTKNRAFDSVTLAALADAALIEHLRALLDHALAMSELHFWLHGYDTGAVARYIVFTKAAGIPTSVAVTALAGASPSTHAPRQELAAIRGALAGRQPGSLDEVRAASPSAAALLDTYLADRASTLVTRYDIDGLTLGELPETVLASILQADDGPDQPSGNRGRGGPGDGADAVATVRALVPTSQQVEFDLVLADARDVMDMRDDNGPTVFEWPVGLIRLALLELGRRLVATGRAHRPEHALELDPDEIRHQVAGGQGPSPDELAARRDARLALARLVPPATLGPIEPKPPLEALPRPLAQIVLMITTALEELGMSGRLQQDPFVGVGIGQTVYRGRVRRGDTPEEAIEAMEPGDVLVVRATSPAFNSVLAIAGAVVTADGGALSHAAVLARELGIAAVVGAAGALDLPDGAMVDVDPIAGRVTIVT